MPGYAEEIVYLDAISMGGPTNIAGITITYVSNASLDVLLQRSHLTVECSEFADNIRAVTSLNNVALVRVFSILSLVTIDDTSPTIWSLY